MAEELGFLAPFENSLDAVSDRDFVAESLFDLALLGVHLSRMGEELVLWSTEEFAFCVLDDAYATGSSMLPQKKNPDVAELARGKAGRLIGHLTGLLVTLKGLPLAYNRDLQEDKEPLFDAVIQVRGALRALRGLFGTLTWNLVRMAEAADASAGAAVDLAEMLVVRGMPFRQAHALVAALVRDSLERHVPLSELVGSHPDLGARGGGPVGPRRGRDPTDLARRSRSRPGEPSSWDGSAAGSRSTGPACRRCPAGRGRPRPVERERRHDVGAAPGGALGADGGFHPGGPVPPQQAARPRRPDRPHRRGRGLPG